MYELMGLGKKSLGRVKYAVFCIQCGKFYTADRIHAAHLNFFQVNFSAGRHWSIWDRGNQKQIQQNFLPL